MNTDPQIRAAGKSLMQSCMGVRPGESVLVVTDEKILPIAYAFVEAGRELGHDTILIESASQLKGEPSLLVANAMKSADVAFLLTSMSYSHTAARNAATQNGVRIASMPMMTEHIAKTCLTADYAAIKVITAKLAQRLTMASDVRVTTPLGTDITFSVKGRECREDNGVLVEKGANSNLPAGEAYIAPLETTGTGTLVCGAGDVIAYIGIVEDDVTLTLKDGYITNIEGGKTAGALTRFLADKDGESRGISEFGVGTNANVRLMGHPLVDEKVYGTVHIAFGTNKFFGGERLSNIHYDCVINKPSVYLDGVAIMRDGEHNE